MFPPSMNNNIQCIGLTAINNIQLKLFSPKLTSCSSWEFLSLSDSTYFETKSGLELWVEKPNAIFSSFFGVGVWKTGGGADFNDLESREKFMDPKNK